MKNEKSVHLPKKLHDVLKIQAVKENTTIQAYVAKVLWHKLGGVVHA